MAAEIPQGWSVDRVRGYYAWAHAVIAGLRNTNAWLERALDHLFDDARVLDPATSERVPVYDATAGNQALLTAYLASMAVATN